MGIRVLFVYPNYFGMNMLPPAIALLSAVVKKKVMQLSYLIRPITTKTLLELTLMV